MSQARSVVLVALFVLSLGVPVAAAAQSQLDAAARLAAARRADREAALAAQVPVPVDPVVIPATGLTPEDQGTVTAVLGSGLIVGWPDASTRIAVADDSVATLTVISPREVVVNGLKAGRTSIFVWLADGRRLYYPLVVEYNLAPARAALRDVAPGLILESGADEGSVVLHGEVPNESIALQARAVVEQLLPRGAAGDRQGLRLVNLVRYAGFIGTADDRLAAGMRAIDPRIRVRRIQGGNEPDLETDSYVLEGQVRDVNALVRAVVLADRQLGGTGKTVRAADDDRVTFERSSTSGLSGIGGGGGLQALQGGEPPESGISAQLARGLLVTSESGRVVSFLSVDSLPQIMVAIRVLEVDRTKARRLGLDFRVDTENLSIGSFTIPGAGNLSDPRGAAGTLAGSGNLVGTFVDKTLGVMAAFDLLSEKQVARSVAEPNILTLSGERASVLVGGEVPIPAAFANQVSVQSGFSFQQFGVRLDIRPTVDAAGVVTMEVAPSIVTPSATLGNGSVPGFRIQRVETAARVQAGESLVLGGLLNSVESVQDRGIPLLGVIPIFRWQRTSTQNTELLFVITPRIIEPPSVAVRLPPLEFQQSPSRTGVTGLDAQGVPFVFRSGSAKVLGKKDVCLEVRERPTADGALSDCVAPESTVFVLESSGEWHRIRTADGTEGWAQAARLELVEEKP